MIGNPTKTKTFCLINNPNPKNIPLHISSNFFLEPKPSNKKQIPEHIKSMVKGSPCENKP